MAFRAASLGAALPAAAGGVEVGAEGLIVGMSTVSGWVVPFTETTLAACDAGDAKGDFGDVAAAVASWPKIASPPVDAATGCMLRNLKTSAKTIKMTMAMMNHWRLFIAWAWKRVLFNMKQHFDVVIQIFAEGGNGVFGGAENWRVAAGAASVRPQIETPPTRRVPHFELETCLPKLDTPPMDPSPDVLLNALKTVKYPGFSRDIVSFGLVRSAIAHEGLAQARLEITTADPELPKKLHDAAVAALRAVPGIERVDVEVAVKVPAKSPPPSGAGALAALPSQLQKVRYRVAVASGKGGVGKSTFAVNLACAFGILLAKAGRARGVGLMDCDIYGPSIPLMLGVNVRPEIEGELLQPVENFGVRMMSMGLLIDDDTPVAWRGPMVTKTIQQFAAQVAWGELEILVVDLPPGTGDAQITLAQAVPLTGTVIVTTPQLAAVSVARRGAMLFDKVNVPLLGVAENMSFLENPDGTRQHIFGEGGGPRAALDLHTEFLGQVPLDTRIRAGGDRGIPVVVSHPDILAAQAFLGIAARLLEKLDSSFAKS